MLGKQHIDGEWGGEIALDHTVSGITASRGISGSKTWLLSEINSKIKIWFPTFLSTKKISQDSVSCFIVLIPRQLFSHAVLSKAENESGHPEVTWFYPLTCWKAFPQPLWVFSNDVRKNIFCICFVLFLRASG